MNKVKRFKRLKRRIKEADRQLQQAEYFGKGAVKSAEKKLNNLNTQAALLMEGQK